MGKGLGVPKRRKSAVVATKSILMAANVLIIGGHHVLALQSPPEGWQATSLLERCREHACRRRAHGAAVRALSGRDQRFAGIGLAAVDRGFGGLPHLIECRLHTFPTRGTQLHHQWRGIWPGDLGSNRGGGIVFGSAAQHV